MLKQLFAAFALLTAFDTQTLTLEEILQRAGTYAVDYENRFSVLVAEERYEQRQIKQMAAPAGNLTLTPGGEARREQLRTLSSDYLLVRLEGGGGWMPFRDVFEVDGRKVRGREERVLNLFLKPGANSLEQARRIMADSTRFNLGSVQRTINIPTLAVLLLQPELASRFAFDRENEETIDGTRVAVLAYKEVARPSLIRTTNGEDLALSGKLWIEPDTGTIVRTAMTVSDANVRAQSVVTFVRDNEVDFWVPVRMEETYTSRANETITCVATYSRYRRFNGNTVEQIRKPPQE